MIIREQLAKLLQHQHRGEIETWKDTSEFRQEQYLNQADTIITLFVDVIRNLEFSPNTPLNHS